MKKYKLIEVVVTSDNMIVHTRIIYMKKPSLEQIVAYLKDVYFLGNKKVKIEIIENRIYVNGLKLYIMYNEIYLMNNLKC